MSQGDKAAQHSACGLAMSLIMPGLTMKVGRPLQSQPYRQQGECYENMGNNRQNGAEMWLTLNHSGSHGHEK